MTMSPGTTLTRCSASAALFDRLEKMGIQDGDTVDIYDLQFDYMR